MPRSEIRRTTWTPAKPSVITGLLGGREYSGSTGCHAVVTREPDGLHISVSAPRRYPTWDEMASARDTIAGPDVRMVMHLPPRNEYVNLHATTLHLWEVRDA